ncbi:hypothetical protein EUGRSUZ_E02928 [Eucalyptus grandis]|uniref:Uncharacterized protein n=2 Tax=Eucalyptus grandis TaxID=71139 RepID=A0ACC3KXD2_EUCGR|nr:hypothetical protein EUGRSUZ_E02928 [Eucalyptus grandis]
MERGKQRGQSRNELKSYLQCNRIQNEPIQLWASSMGQQRPRTASSHRPQKLDAGTQSRDQSPKQCWRGTDDGRRGGWSMVLGGSRSERSHLKIETITGEAVIAMVAGEAKTQTEEPSTVENATTDR